MIDSVHGFVFAYFYAVLYTILYINPAPLVQNTALCGNVVPHCYAAAPLTLTRKRTGEPLPFSTSWCLLPSPPSPASRAKRLHPLRGRCFPPDGRNATTLPAKRDGSSPVGRANRPHWRGAPASYRMGFHPPAHGAATPLQVLRTGYRPHAGHGSPNSQNPQHATRLESLFQPQRRRKKAPSCGA